MTPVETAQQILDGTWTHASAALQGCKRGEWARFVREVAPMKPLADALWACTVRRWTAAIVVESRAYAPEIPMRLRAGAFSVLEVEVDEVLSVDVQETEPLPRPTRELPMFAVGFEPRVRVSRALESQIRDMGFVVEDEGE